MIHIDPDRIDTNAGMVVSYREILCTTWQNTMNSRPGRRGNAALLLSRTGFGWAQLS